jgi:hypothetical protein
VLPLVGLARACTIQGNIEKARRFYEDLFLLWKNADPDIPILNQAKAEYKEFLHYRRAQISIKTLDPEIKYH